MVVDLRRIPTRHHQGLCYYVNKGAIAHLRTKYPVVKGSRPLSLQNKWQVKQNAGSFSTKLEVLALGRQWKNGAGIWVGLWVMNWACCVSKAPDVLNVTLPELLHMAGACPGSFLLQFKQFRLLQVLGPGKSFEITCGFEEFMRLNQET